MGVDATLMVPAKWSPPDLGYIEVSICLSRWREDWKIFSELKPAKQLSSIQLAHGSWVTYGDGTRPDDRMTRELGYLFEDSYGNSGFPLFRVTDLAPHLPKFSEHNRKILAFIVDSYPTQHFLIFWH